MAPSWSGGGNAGNHLCINQKSPGESEQEVSSDMRPSMTTPLFSSEDTVDLGEGSRAKENRSLTGLKHFSSHAHPRTHNRYTAGKTEYSWCDKVKTLKRKSGEACSHFNAEA